MSRVTPVPAGHPHPGPAGHPHPGSSAPRIELDTLRDHGQGEHVDRVWERLEGNLTVGSAPGSVAAKARSSSRSFALGMAAGIALGLFGAKLAFEQAGAPDTRLSPDAEQDAAREVFAAGTSRRSYVLPGGVELVLEPGSIVDSVESSGGRGITLRLVRGEALLTTPDGDEHPLALQIGGAEVATAAGSMRVRLDGETAELTVLRGIASVTEPHPDTGAAQHIVVGENQKHRVRVRVITASLTPPHAMRAPSTPDETRDKESEPSEITSDDNAAAVVAVPSWQTACELADYDGALALLKQQPGGVDGALGIVGPTYLACLASGHEEVGDKDGAKRINDRIITDHGSDPYAPLAADALERMYRAEGDEAKADAYAKKKEELEQLSKGRVQLPSEKALCNKVHAASSRADANEVRRLAAAYNEQFPDGECSDAIDALLAKLPAPEPVPSAPAPIEDDTYPEASETSKP